MVMIDRFSHSVVQSANFATHHAKSVTKTAQTALHFTQTCLTHSMLKWQIGLRSFCNDKFQHILLRIILPSYYKYTHSEIDNLQIRANVEIAEIVADGKISARRVKIPSENAMLDGIRISHTDARVRPTIVFFTGNNALWQESVDFLDWVARKTDCNILSCNYRGIVLPVETLPTGLDLIHDGKTLVRSLITDGIQPKKIILYGLSLGGAVATLSAADLADDGIKVSVINDRSFRSIQAMVFTVVRFLKNFFAKQITKVKWGLDAESAIPRLKGALIVISNENDQMIAYKESFKAAIDSTVCRIKKLFMIAMDDADYSDEDPDAEIDSCDFSHNRLFSTKEIVELNRAIYAATT